MLKEHLNIESNLRVVQTSVWFDEAQAGNFDLAISAIVSTLMDPSDIFSAWYGQGRRRTTRAGRTRPSTTIANQVERELDDNKRRMLVRKAEDILENDRRSSGVVRADLRRLEQQGEGQNPSTYFGIYDVVRWDNVC